MSFAEVWNDALEGTPAGTAAVSTVDDRIRELKVDIRERAQVEHNWSTHNGGTDDGTHKEGECGVVKVDTTANIATLSNVANAIAYDTTLSQFKTNNGSGWTVRDTSPAGCMMMWAGLVAAPPTGWLFCNGAAVSRTTYAALYAAIGTIHGVGDGATTFNLPDLRDVFVAGAKQDDSGVPKTNLTGSLTASGGSADHTHTGPSHTHTGPSHTHGAGTLALNAGDNATWWIANGSYGLASASSHTHNVSGSTAAGGTGATSASGTGATGNNSAQPPYKALGYIIKY